MISALSPEWNSAYTQKEDTSSGNKEDFISIDDSQLILINDSAHPVFKLKLHKTYYNQGFFNVIVGYDQYFGKDNENIDLYIGDTDQIITGYINRIANTNGTSRIMGGKELKKYFQTNFNIDDPVYIQILSPILLKLWKNIK